jgi:membrane associated rhomboid family serine protease
MPPLPPITQFLILLCTAVFCLEFLAPSRLVVQWLALWPPQSGRFLPWQPISYAFVHANFTHLLFNMFGLWMFGAELERLWGGRRYLLFLAAGVLAGALAFWGMVSVMPVFAAQVGASAGVYALILANGLLFPHRRITLIIPPVDMSMRTFIIGFVAITIGFALFGGLNELAHLGGMLGGWLVLRYWAGKPPFGGGGRGRRGGGSSGPRRLH